jgi:hypothetical protein
MIGDVVLSCYALHAKGTAVAHSYQDGSARETPGRGISRSRSVGHGDAGPRWIGTLPAALALQRSAGNRATTRALSTSDSTRGAPTVQRTILLGGVKQNTYTLSEALAPVLPKTSSGYRYLWPIAERWLKPDTDHGDFANAGALRTALINDLTQQWIDEVKTSTPTLRATLTTEQFNTIVFMVKLARFNPASIEAALLKVKKSAHIAQDTITDTISPGKLPGNAPTNAIFTTDFTAQEPGVVGLAAEFEAAAAINPTQLRKGEKVRLSQHYQLDGAIGGQTTQDADAAYVERSGSKVLIEVAATIDRLRDKMGANGLAQRQRYGRIRENNPGVVLAYSVPNTWWGDFFTGDRDSQVGRRLSALDDGWGLILDGGFVAPATLAAVADAVAGARLESVIPRLRSSRMSFTDVSAKDAAALTKDLAKFRV